MKQVTGEKFVGAVVNIDDVAFDGCTFDGCTIVYSAAGKISLQRCEFDGCRWAFDGHAATTLQLMSIMYKIGAKQMIENTFEQIRGKPVKGPTLQ